MEIDFSIYIEKLCDIFYSYMRFYLVFIPYTEVGNDPISTMSIFRHRNETESKTSVSATIRKDSWIGSPKEFLQSGYGAPRTIAIPENAISKTGLAVEKDVFRTWVYLFVFL